jgi:hypothetical protein
MANVIHYYPDALVVFVKGFREVENVSREDLLMIQTKEIMSANITLTVANSASTFSLTINDTANKFFQSDNPELEVRNLRANSEFQVKRDVSQRGFKSQKKGGLSYYEFNGFRGAPEDINKWFDFEWGTLVAVDNNSFRTIVFYRRNPAGDIVERWAFDEKGDIIRVVPHSISEKEFRSPNSNGKTFLLKVENDKKRISTRYFTLLKTKNSDFMLKYQNEVNNPLKLGRLKIEPMDRVAIFLSKRYEKTNDGSWQIVQSPKTELIRTFTGLVNTVQAEYSPDAGNIITVSGEDVTKWLKLSVVPVNPALLTDQTGDALRFSYSDTSDLNFYTNIFQGMKTPDLIKLLTVGYEGLEDDDKSKISGNFKKVRGVDTYSVARNATTNPENIVYDQKLNAFRIERNNKHVKTVSTVNIRDMMGSLFTKSSVHVIDPTKSKLDAYLAYNENFQLPSEFQTEYQNRRDICYKAAEDSNFNFYADRNGHIWFHPPRYSNAWILLEENDKLRIIDENSIINYAFVEDDSNVYSTCVVSSEPDLRKNVVPGTEMFNRGSYTDELLTYKYGNKILTESNPFVAKMGGSSVPFASESATFYAKAKLMKLLANKSQGQITITGRAEIDPGFPIYIPFRNMIYWVETVDHSFSFGGQFTTTLHLAYGRKPWETIAEVITQSFDMIHSTDGHISIVREPQKNQPSIDGEGKRKSKPISDDKLNPDIKKV